MACWIDGVRSGWYELSVADVQIYSYDKCSTCKKALRWLEAHGVAFDTVDIVAEAPTPKTLARVLELSGLPVKKLFNTSGQSYRLGGWKERLPTLSEEQALSALAADAKLIKRPIVLAASFALVGFNEAAYAEHFEI